MENIKKQGKCWKKRHKYVRGFMVSVAVWSGYAIGQWFLHRFYWPVAYPPHIRACFRLIVSVARASASTRFAHVDVRPLSIQCRFLLSFARAFSSQLNPCKRKSSYYTDIVVRQMQLVYAKKMSLRRAHDLWIVAFGRGNIEKRDYRCSFGPRRIP